MSEFEWVCVCGEWMRVGEWVRVSARVIYPLFITATRQNIVKLYLFAWTVMAFLVFLGFSSDFFTLSIFSMLPFSRFLSGFFWLTALFLMFLLSPPFLVHAVGSERRFCFWMRSRMSFMSFGFLWFFLLCCFLLCGLIFIEPCCHIGSGSRRKLKSFVLQGLSQMFRNGRL